MIHNRMKFTTDLTRNSGLRYFLRVGIQGNTDTVQVIIHTSSFSAVETLVFRATGWVNVATLGHAEVGLPDHPATSEAERLAAAHKAATIVFGILNGPVTER